VPFAPATRIVNSAQSNLGSHRWWRVSPLLDTAHNAHEISLAQNVIRSTMHPPTSSIAFAKLRREEGMAAEDIAGAVRRHSDRGQAASQAWRG